MAVRKRTPARRAASPSRRKRRASASSPIPTPIADQIAIRYRDGQEPIVRDTLSAFGTLEAQPRTRILILHRAAGISPAKVDAAVRGLQAAKAVEFATPVLRDPESHTRQVLTDEIVLRLKPGHTKRTLAALTAEHGVAIGKRNEFEPTQYIVKVLRPSGTQTLEVARALDRRDDVEFASPNFLTDIKR
jgi:hypothetical protein